jgi:ArsR family transcriptional regulator, arsenate/arsenite/antimonite-responsive transcriptional repressor
VTFGLCPAGAAARTVEAVNTSTTLELSPTDLAPESRADGSRMLAVVADPVRWRLLAELAAGARCVCTLQPAAGVSAPALSHHLRVLREAGLVTAARRGRWIDYTLAPDAAQRMAAALPDAAGSTEAPACCPDGSEPG